MQLELKKFKTGFQDLHAQVIELQMQINKLNPSLILLCCKSKLTNLEEKLEKLDADFYALDIERVSTFPETDPGYNSSVMLGASHFLAYNLRESVRTVSMSCHDTLNGIHTKLDFLLSLIVSAVALVVSIVALVAPYNKN